MRYDIGLLANRILDHLNTHPRNRKEKEVILHKYDILEAMKYKINNSITMEDIEKALSILIIEGLIKKIKDDYKITEKGTNTILANPDIYISH